MYAFSNVFMSVKSIHINDALGRPDSVLSVSEGGLKERTDSLSGSVVIEQRKMVSN